MTVVCRITYTAQEWHKCEIFSMAHLMCASMLVYKIDLDFWQRQCPAFVDRNFNDDMVKIAMYIRNCSGHFDVILSVSYPPQSEYNKKYSRGCYKVNTDPKSQIKFDTLRLYHGSLGLAILFEQGYSLLFCL